MRECCVFCVQRTKCYGHRVPSYSFRDAFRTAHDAKCLKLCAPTRNVRRDCADADSTILEFIRLHANRALMRLARDRSPGAVFVSVTWKKSQRAARHPSDSWMTWHHVPVFHSGSSDGDDVSLRPYFPSPCPRDNSNPIFRHLFFGWVFQFSASSNFHTLKDALHCYSFNNSLVAISWTQMKIGGDNRPRWSAFDLFVQYSMYTVHTQNDF